MDEYGYIRDNLSRVRRELAAAAQRGGHPVPALVAVTKSATDEEVLALVQAGQRCIAENRTALFCRRYDLFPDDARPEMHLIGTLQTNKAKTVAGKAALIQSLDSLHLARELSKLGQKLGASLDVLAEVNSGKEPAKGGLLPEDVPGFLAEVASLPALRMRGLMTMGPAAEDPEAYRPYFAATRALFLRMQEVGYFAGEGILSMGMSGSFTVAAEEGATMVRVGRTLFVKKTNLQ